MFKVVLFNTEKVEILRTEFRFGFSADLLHSKLKKWGLGNV